MRTFIFLLIITIIPLSITAKNWMLLDENNSQNSIQLISSNINSSNLSFHLEGFWYEEIETPMGTAWKITSDYGSPILEQGNPELPLYASSLVIPVDAEMGIRIISAEYRDFENILVSPSKGNLYRNIDPLTVDLTFGKRYTVDEFYPKNIVELNEPYIVRDIRGQTVQVKPMQYNPVSRTLRVYYDIEFELYEMEISNVNTPHSKEKVNNYHFESIYNRHFINYKQTTRYSPVEETGNMLIISHAEFMDEMDPYIDWKVKSGTPVEIVNVETIGGSSDISQYIVDYYNENGLTFVLLVGDNDQVPTSSIGGNYSDVAYSYIAGNDHYPDLFVGRFSAETEDQLITQVERVLEYEQTPVSDTAWYTKSIGIASSQGPGDNDEMDYEHIRNISNLNLLPFTYNYDYEFFDGSQGGNDAAGNPNPTMVGDALNSGASIVNYTGHGSTSSWSTSGFSNNNINSLSNEGRLPFIISVACVNGNFVNTTCFAETWLRAENNGEPTGAIAAIMSTINQSWDPPMRGQDEMNDILTETYSNNIKRTFGGITMNGCMNMNDIYGSNGFEMTDTWTIFGDPSLEIRTAPPVNLAVSYPGSLFLGATTFTITCDVNGAKATLSMDGEIIGTAIVTEGTAVIEFDALSQVGTANVVVTAFNAIPHISTVDIVPADGPFIVYVSNTINDASGNNNGLLDYNETISLTIGLANVGTDPASGITATLSTESEYIQIIDFETDYGNIAVEDTAYVTDGFELAVSNDIPDEEVISFNINTTDTNGNSWESVFTLLGHAPKLEFVSYQIDDSNGNNNGKADPGENFNMIIELENKGSSDAYNVLSGLTSTSPFVNIQNNHMQIGNLQSFSSTEVVYNTSADISTPEGTLVPFNILMNADHDITGSGDFSIIIGQKPVLILNLAGSASSDSMAACLAELQVGYDIENSWSDDIDQYQSLFVLLGIYPNNYMLTDAEGDALKNYLESGGRVYMEGGDTWAFDTKTSVHEMFHIVGLEDGFGDLSTIEGEDDCMMYGYFFDYNGFNNYIDKIIPEGEGELIFSNEFPSYGIGVSFDSDVYRTIGTSFEFAGLMDGEGSSKDGLMAEILYFFELEYTWTNISDKEVVSALDIFPNPAIGEVVIQFEVTTDEIISIDVFNIQGQKMLQVTKDKVFTSGIHRVNVSMQSLKPGVYFYSIRNAKGNSVNKKIVNQ